MAKKFDPMVSLKKLKEIDQREIAELKTELTRIGGAEQNIKKVLENIKHFEKEKDPKKRLVYLHEVRVGILNQFRGDYREERLAKRFGNLEKALKTLIENDKYPQEFKDVLNHIQKELPEVIRILGEELRLTRYLRNEEVEIEKDEKKHKYKEEEKAVKDFEEKEDIDEKMHEFLYRNMHKMIEYLLELEKLENHLEAELNGYSKAA